MSRRVIMPVFLGGGDTPTSNYAVNLSMTMDSNYIISAQLIDQDGNYLGTEQTIDLPIESTVVNGTYDSNTKSIILTLNNGNTITIPVADLVSGLQTEITSQNPLSADFITDGTTNKVFTASDKQSLMDAISATSNLGTMAYQDASNYTPSASLSSVATSGSYNDLSNKPTIPTATSDLTNDSGYITGITSSDVTTALGYTPSNFSGSYNDLSNKPDLSIYAQSSSLSSVATSGSYNDLSNKPTIPTATSDLTNDSGYITGITSSDVTTALGYTPGTSNFSGDYDDLTDKPTLGTMAAESASDYTPTASLATVATSGDYDDLIDKPDLSGYRSVIELTDLTQAQLADFYTNYETLITQNTYVIEGYSFSVSPYKYEVQPGVQLLILMSNVAGTVLPTNIYPLGGVMTLNCNLHYLAPNGVLQKDSYNNEFALVSRGQDGSITTWDANNNQTIISPNGITINGNSVATTNQIPTVNDATITLTQGGVTKGTFTLNQSSNTTIDFGQGMSSVDWSDINNKPNFATVATSGSYNDLSNKPTIPAAQVNSDWTANSGVSQILNKPNLATVATSGSYNDLSNLPTIPVVDVNAAGDNTFSGNNTFTNYTVFGDETIQMTSIDGANISTYDNTTGDGVNVSVNQIEIVNAYDTSLVISSQTYNNETTSQISSVGSLDIICSSVSVNGENIATESYVNTAISNIPSPMIFKGSLGTGGTITTLPSASSANEGFTYKVITDGTYASQVAKVGDMFISDGTNWVYIPSADEPSGTVTSVGLTVPTGLSVSGSPITSSGTLAISLESGYSIPTTQKQSEWDAKSTFSGSYTDLTNKPTIPTATSDLTNDSGFITGITSTDVTTALGYTPGTSSFSGSYTDLTNKPTIPAAQVNSDWSASSGVAQILNKPDLSIYAQSSSLATVATSGSYADLTNTPTIPAAQVNADWDAVSGVAQILNKPTLSTVATSGSYNDLSNKPSIPAAQVNADWDAVSGVSQILNKPNLATVATSGSYADLTNKPTIPAAQIQSDWTQTTTTALDYIKNKPNLATVATSGSYNDLSNKPTIPSAANDAKLNIQRNTNTAVKVFSANESTNKTINFTAGNGMSLSEDTSTANTYKLTITHATPTGATTKTSGFYKFSTDARGHVNGTTAVGTSDISALLSSQTLTFVDGQGNTTTITFYTTA